jgi:hypothetical protein
MKNCCVNHGERIAAVGTGQGQLCWECYLGAKKFADRFGIDFYARRNKKRKDSK